MSAGKGRAGRRGKPRDADVAAISETRGVFMISVAAELAEMHPQTLRMYEARGLITPKRSPKNTRLYSQRDVERLREIQRLTTEGGLNLAGVEVVLELNARAEQMRADMARMRRRMAELERNMLEEVERVRRQFRAEIVPYGAYDEHVLGSPRRQRTVKIRVEESDRESGGRKDGGDAAG